MGLVPVQVTEYLSRLTRGAGLKGRLRFLLDDTMVPVVQVFDMTRAPWRLDEQQYFLGELCIAAAANCSIVQLRNETGKPVVVEHFLVSNNGATVMGIRLGFDGQLFAAQGAPAKTAATWEGQVAAAADAGVKRLSALSIRYSNILVGLQAPTVEIARGSLAAFGTAGDKWEEDGCDIVVAPGGALSWYSTVVNTSYWVNVRVRVSNNAVVGS